MSLSSPKAGPLVGAVAAWSLLAPFLHAQAEPAPIAARAIKLTNVESSYPHWSPDGRRIVFQSNRTGNSEIYLMNADGTGVVRLTDHPATDENPAWSPDGRRIAFRSYRDGNAEIYLMAADGSDLRNLTNHPADDIHPYWRPDGSRILFNSNRTRNGAGAPVLTIFSMRADGSDVRALTREPIEETYAQYSPDGSRIAFRRRLDEEEPGWERNPGNSEIFVAGADGSAPRRLTNHPGFDGWPSWSPDGRWIAYAAEGSGEFQIQLMRPDGTGTRRVTDGPGSFTKPIFSSDGRRIVCTRTLEGNVEIFVIELATETAGPAAPRTAAGALFRAAAAAMGGLGLLRDLPALTTGYHLIERSLGQEEWPEGPAASSLHLGRREFDPRARRERLTMRRHMSGGRVYERVLDAGPWRRVGAGGSSPASAESALSAALATLHPEALLPALLADTMASAVVGRPTPVAGKRAAPVRTRLGGQPLTLYFDQRDSLLLAVEWTDRDLGPTDEPVRAIFSQYRPASGLRGEPRLPHLVEVWRGGRLWQTRSYDELRSGAGLSPRETAAASATDPRPVAIAPGVDHLRGSDYHSLMVDAGDRIVVVDLPEAERAGAVLELARRRAAGRPVTVVASHLHDDHVGGLPAAAGLEVIASARLAEPVRSLLGRGRPGEPLRVRPVTDVLRLGSDRNVVELRTIPHSHAEGMLVAYLPAHQILFEVDLIRGLLPHATAELVAWVERTGLRVRTVVSSHGGEQPWEQVVARANAWRQGLARNDSG